MPEPMSPLESLARLKSIVDRLRSPGGCPWDLEQTPETLKPFLLEEAHEVAEAIERADPADLRDELGDLLMNIFLQARIGEERGTFTLADVSDRIAEKLVRRHPHVFGDALAADSDAVRRNWEEIKRREKGESAAPASAIRPLPASLPALARADRIGRFAAEVGFDWPDADGPLAKLDEELAELREACARGDRGAIESEVGDLLFAASSLCRKHGIDAEAALRGSLARFTDRFRTIEAELRRSEDRSLPHLDRLWERAKRRARPAAANERSPNGRESP